MTDAAANTRAAAAEALRLQGNDAFGTSDWKRAASLYQDSIATKPGPKTHANLAATLCKLGRYEEASKEAARATALDPTWAKGWWRRGVVAELQKLFLDALQYYSLAVELEPKEKTFKKALQDVKKRAKVKTEDEITEAMKAFKFDKQDYSVAAKAFLQVAGVIGGSSYSMARRFERTQSEYPTSQQYLFHGFQQWVGGMKSVVGNLCTTVSRDAKEQWEALARNWRDRDQDYLRAEALIGGTPTPHDAANLTSGLAHLGGLYIGLESGSAGIHDRAPRLCPQPQFLIRFGTYQSLAILCSVVALLQTLFNEFRFHQIPGFKVSKAIVLGCVNFYENAGGVYPYNSVLDPSQDATPEEIVNFIKRQLAAGRTWNGGLRRYVALNFRGTLLVAATWRLLGNVGPSYQFDKWANEFITLADEAFKVTKENAYAERGSAFRPSLRIGFLMSELQTHTVLRGNSIGGPYSMQKSLDLCVKIVEMAHGIKKCGAHADFFKVQDDVAFRRKPLALAHSMIGHHLNAMRQVVDSDHFKQIAAHYGFIDQDAEFCDPFALVVNHYRIAAENELPDSDDGALFWWACAANMSLASSQSGFTLGELRAAILSAQAAEQARDTSLFGPNPENGSYQTVSKVMANRFQDEADSFVLPQAEIVRNGANKEPSMTMLKVGDEVICPDFGEFERLERENTKTDNPLSEMMDTSKIESKHGASHHVGIPSLETLCIRELHKTGFEHAKGETDGAVIHLKAMQAASQKKRKAKR